MLIDGLRAAALTPAPGKRVLSLDCSAINRLTEDKQPGCMIGAIETAYFVRLTATNVEEVVATPKKKTLGNTKARKRDALLKTCGNLLAVGECIFPYHLISDVLVRDYQKHGVSHWQSLPLRSLDYEDSINRPELVNALSVEQRNFAKRQQKKFARTFDGVGRKLERLFKKGKIKRPASFAQLLAILSVPKGAFWHFAAVFYRHGATRKPGLAKLKKFLNDCPPFHAFVLSLVMAEYGYSILNHRSLWTHRADRSDLLSALYLPYCDIFVTDDKKQLRCLPEIGAACGLSVEVLRYRDFRKRFIP